MDNLRLLMPTDNANASRYRPVQHVNGRVVRECCQSDGSKPFAFSWVLTKTFFWNRNYLTKVSIKRILKF